MAHKNKKKSRVLSARKPETRGHLLTARPNLGRRFRLSDLLHRIKPIQTRLQQAEDLRRVPREFRQSQYHLSDGRLAPVRHETIQPRMRWMPAQVHPYFQRPERTVVCIRRKERRRVLFALQKTGQGGRRNRSPKWTVKSYIRCR